MKILHLNSAPTWRGGEQQLVYLIEELAKLGVENRVICRTGSPLANYLQAHQIPYDAIPFRGSADLRSAWQICRIGKSWGADVVHMHTAKAHALAVYAHLLGMHIPLVLSRKIDFVLRTNALTRWKYNYSGIQKILCVSGKVQDIVRAVLKQPSKAVVVHDGIDPDRFQHSGPYHWLRSTYHLPEGKILIGNTAALAPHKDYFTFLDTAKILIDEGLDAHFFIMGEGELRAPLEQHRNQLGLEKQVIFTGFLNNLPEVLPELDVFLMTSEEEGLGSSILDAFCVGVPVVATAAGGIPEIVEHEQTGLLAPVRSPKELADHVLRVQGDNVLRSHLVTQAQRRLQTSFTTQTLAEQTLEHYRAILSSPHP
ncbi:MAG: glycosyltransferase family 4 protein [Bacteroidota bacterium]